MAFERRVSASWAVHPGEILRHEFLNPLKLSEYAVAKALGVNAQRVNDITKRKVGVSAEMALLLGAYFRTTPEFWMNLQSSYELSQERKRAKATGKLKRIVPHSAAA